MSHTPHALAEDFPADAERIAALRQTDAHFARLVERYHEINRAVHRAESQVAPVGEAHETDLRRERMILKDAIARALAEG